MVESGLRHNPNGSYDQALKGIAGGQYIGNDEHKLRAFQKLAEASGLADKTRGQAGPDYGDMGAASQWDTNRDRTIRDHVAMKLAEIEARKQKDAANV
jgi:hypothetical protein